MKKALNILGMGLLISVASFTAQAELIDQYPAANSEYANAYKYGSTSASINLTVEGSGINRTVTLSHSLYSYSQGINNYWRGNIDSSDVTVNGIGQIVVAVDTCGYTADRTWGEDACGRVDVTFTKGSFLWRTDGSLVQDWAPLTNTVNGGITAFSAEVSGYVKGVDMIGASRPAMGKYANVEVVVEVADAAN
jgi:hypothetical protein